MTEAILGYGASFSVESTDSPGVYIELAEVVDITPPNQQVDKVDATHMKSPGRVREYIAGLTTPGDMSLTMNFIPRSDTDVLIKAWRRAGDTRNCRITWPTGDSPEPTDTFPGFPSGYAPTLNVADKASATLTITVAGDITEAG